MPSIKSKLLASFFAIIAVLLISEGFFIAMDYIILSKYMTLTDNMISEYKLIEDTDDLISSFNKRVKSPLDKAEINRFNSIYSDIRSLLDKLKIVIVGNESQIAFIGLENNINDVFFDVEIGINSLFSGDYLEALNRYEAASHKNSFVRENAVNLLLKELEYAENLQIEIEWVRLLSQLIAILLLILAAGGSAWYAITFSKRLISPLVDLSKLAKVIEEGDLSATVDKTLISGGDEVASLASSFNTMVLSLRSSIQKLQEYNLEIKNSRNRLRAEKNKLQQYLDIAGVLVIIFDSNNNVLLINKKGREILGIEDAEIIGQDWISLFVARGDRVKTRSFLNFVRGAISTTDTIENILIAKDKTPKNIVWHFSLLKEENQAAPTVLATGVDVTELTTAKTTISQLKEVDKLKNEVLNIATHELKTPLISVVGLSEVMEKQPKTIPAEYLKYISIIHAEGLKLTNLIKTMLAANRNELGSIRVVKEKFNLADLLLSLQTSLGVLVKRTDSQVAFAIQTKGKVNLESDKTKISQVIYNFVDNAVKYGPQKQTITIELTKPDLNTIKVAVSGAGPGITPEDQKKIFHKFSQLEPSLSRSQEGMGLGLYICKQNIESLGGKIGVTSQPNQGATFYFTLPL